MEFLEPRGWSVSEKILKCQEDVFLENPADLGAID